MHPGGGLAPCKIKWIQGGPTSSSCMSVYRVYIHRKYHQLVDAAVGSLKYLLWIKIPSWEANISTPSPALLKISFRTSRLVGYLDQLMILGKLVEFLKLNCSGHFGGGFPSLNGGFGRPKGRILMGRWGAEARTTWSELERFPKREMLGSWGRLFIPIPSMGLVYLPAWMVEFFLW